MSVFNVVLKLVSHIPLARIIANRLAVNYIASRTISRPRPYSLWSAEPKPNDINQPGPISDYTSWASLTNKKFSGRHLPPADTSYTNSLPIDAAYDSGKKEWGAITQLFARKGPMVTDRSSLLFMFFAQWFTDSILRVDPTDRRKNTSNHDVDLCQIYGLDEATARLFAHNERGKLRSQQINGEEYLDYLCEPDGAGGWRIKDCYKDLIDSGKLDVILDGFPIERREKFYATGLERGNSSIGYVAISTIFMREHNRLCGELEKRNPGWNDERLFQTARTINIVLLLKLVVEDYINHISGHKLFRLDIGFAEEKDWYRTNWIAMEFDLLYRWHGLVPDTIVVNNQPCPANQFRNNNALLEQVGVSAIINSASSQPAGRIGLFNSPAFLLGAEYQSIKMSRDFRLRSFNDYRERFGYDRLKDFSELTSDIELQKKLKTLYDDNIDKVEYLVGLFAEDRDPGSLFGSLMNAMVAYDAFTQIFTNPLLSRNIYNADTFTEYGLKLIEETTTIQALVARNVAAGGSIKAALGV